MSAFKVGDVVKVAPLEHLQEKLGPPSPDGLFKLRSHDVFPTVWEVSLDDLAMLANTPGIVLGREAPPLKVWVLLRPGTPDETECILPKDLLLPVAFSEITPVVQVPKLNIQTADNSQFLRADSGMRFYSGVISRFAISSVAAVGPLEIETTLTTIKARSSVMADKQFRRSKVLENLNIL